MNKATSHKCRRCGYTADDKRYLLAHFKRKKPCPPLLEDIPLEQLYDENRVQYANTWVHPDTNVIYFMCNKCGKGYDKNASKRAHQKKCDLGPERLFDRPSQFMTSADIERVQEQARAEVRKEMKEEMDSLRHEKEYRDKVTEEIDQLKKQFELQKVEAAARRRHKDLQIIRFHKKKTAVEIEKLKAQQTQQTPNPADSEPSIVIRSFHEPHITNTMARRVNAKIATSDDIPGKDYMKLFVEAVYCFERENNSFLYSAITDTAYLFTNSEQVEPVNGKDALETIWQTCMRKTASMLKAGELANPGDLRYDWFTVRIQEPMRIDDLAAVLHFHSHDETRGHLRYTWSRRFPETLAAMLEADAAHLAAKRAPVRPLPAAE